MGLAKAHEGFNDVALLIALNGKDPLVGSLIAIAGNGAGKAGIQSLNAILKDIGKPQ